MSTWEKYGLMTLIILTGAAVDSHAWYYFVGIAISGAIFMFAKK